MRYNRLGWDSAFFGIPIGRISGDIVDAGGLADAVASADADEIRCLYLLLPLEAECALQHALDAGFRPYDVRVVLEVDLDPAPSFPAGVREALSSDVDPLKRIARARFHETRFFVDRHFPRDRVGEMYVAWVQRGLSTAPVRRTFVAGSAEGFVICHLDSAAGVGEIELIGVAEHAVGTGLGNALMCAAHSVFAAAGLRRACVVTQGRNIAAQRLYQRHGYRTTSAGIWLHRWSFNAALTACAVSP